MLAALAYVSASLCEVLAGLSLGRGGVAIGGSVRSSLDIMSPINVAGGSIVRRAMLGGVGEDDAADSRGEDG